LVIQSSIEKRKTPGRHTQQAEDGRKRGPGTGKTETIRIDCGVGNNDLHRKEGRLWS